MVLKPCSSSAVLAGKAVASIGKRMLDAFAPIIPTLFAHLMDDSESDT